MDEVAGRVLLIEDDEKLAALVARYLTDQGFAVGVEHRGDAAVARILAEQPDVVVLDLMLPGRDGLTVCREVRPAYTGGILVLTARGDDVDEVVGLELGADDYVTKPVRPRVLLARIRTLLRRTKGDASPGRRRIVLGRLALDSANREVTLDGEAVDLTTAEFDLLWYLASRAGEVVDRDRLYTDVRGIAWDGVDRSIDLRISRLRRKLGDEAGRIVKSVRGTGYLMATDP